MYQMEMKHTIEKQENLYMKQAEIVDITVENGKVKSIETNVGAIYEVDSIILATGTYLKGKIHNIDATGSINQNKEWIQEKCGTNTPPTTVPEHPSKGNKKKTLSDIKALEINNLAQSVLKDMIRDELKEQVQKELTE